MNKYTIFISTEAEHDLKEIYAYIKDELSNQSAAKNIKDKIKQSILSLDSMPLRNSTVNDERLASKNIRMMNVENYSIFYRVISKNMSVEIARVIYSKRDWINIL